MKFTRAQKVASFMSKIEILGPNECWIWKACVHSNALKYGAFVWNGKLRGANRVMWAIATGEEPPADLDVLHTCDNSMCVNPVHLFLGTHRDNMLDMHRKQRCTIATLTHDQVRQARVLLREKTRKEVATVFGVKVGVIHDLASGKTFKHVQ